MVEVARAFYLEDRSKVQIAEDTGLSRWQVARLLDEARRIGIVSIRVEDPLASAGDLAERLRQQLGVRHVVVAPAAELHSWSETEQVARALATHLNETVTAGQVLGFGWSRVIETLARRLERLARCDVVQLAGALTFAGDRVGSVEVIRQVARTSGGTAYPIYAPLVAPSAESAASLLASPEIADVIARAGHADHAVVGIGTWTVEGSPLVPRLPEQLVRRTAAAGAAAIVSGRIIDATGRPVDVGVDGRIVGVTLEQLREIPNIICTCVGVDRVDSVRAAVAAGIVDVLIIDQTLARALLEP